MASRNLIQDTYRYFRKTGRWPLVRTLQAEYGSATNVRALAAELGRERIVCQEGREGTCFLTIAVLRELPEAKDDLTHLAAALRVIAESYKNHGERSVTRSALQEDLGLESDAMARVGCLLYQTGRLWTSGSWAQDGSDFSLNPAEEALFYDSVSTYDDVLAVQLKLRADEQRISQLLSEEYRRARDQMVAAGSPKKLEPRYELADPVLDELLARDLAELERVHAASAWKATAILAGSCLETLLLDLCQRDESFMVARFKDKWPRSVGANDLLKAAEARGLINADVHGLTNALRRWRNLIHPAAARESREPTEELASALVANLRLLVADLSRETVAQPAHAANELPDVRSP